MGPCDIGDFECDGDVELDDYAAFENVFYGPDVPVQCTAFDADTDTDVDLFDFSAMQTAFTVQ